MVLIAGVYAAETAELATGPMAEGSFQGSENLRVRFWNIPDTLSDVAYAPDGCLFGDCTHAPDSVLSYQEVVNRLSVSGGTQRLTLALQADAVGLFSNHYILDGENIQERSLYLDPVFSPFQDVLLVLEKVTVEGRGRHIGLVFGDTYAAFGRGLALNLVKNTDVDVDTSLRGAKAVANWGQWELTGLTALTNPQTVALEFPNEDILVDDNHAVSGLRIARYQLSLGPLTGSLGAHGVLYQLRDTGLEPHSLAVYNDEADARVAGANFGMYGRTFEIYLEGDGFFYGDSLKESTGIAQGYAAYGSATVFPGTTTFLLEAKRYLNTEQLNLATGSYSYELAAGPSLEYERVITEDSSAAVNSNDIWGARARVDFSFAPAGGLFSPYLSLAGFRDNDLAGIHFNRSPESIVHPMGGFLWVKDAWDARLNAGFRADLRDPLSGVDQGADTMVHLDGEITIPVASRLSVSLAVAGMQYQWGVNVPQQEDFFESANAISMHIGTPLTLVGYFESSSNPLITSTGNLGDDLYGAAEIQWKPGSATTLKVFYGAYRAGIHCAGGQCRYLPGFNGAKLSFDTVF